MRTLQELFTTDVGLMSISGIAFMLGMGVFFLRYFRRPPTFGSHLQSTMSSFMPVALIMHLGVGVWQISNVAAFR